MKKVLSLVLAALMIASMLVACKPSTEPTETKVDLTGTYDITVWVSESAGVKELTEKQIDEFEKANPGVVINATVEGVTEAESATQMITSVEDGADLYCFAQDQLARLVQAGALVEILGKNKEEITARNDAASVAASTVSGKLYCFPMTSDNGYFMIYDKSVIKEDHLDSFEDIIKDCEDAGRGFSYELETSGWYNAGFFFATGCHSTWTMAADGKSFTNVDDDFNSDAGIIALKGMQKLLNSKAYNSSSSADDFKAAIPAAVVITGTWGTNAAKEALGDNYACTDLPSFTVDGKSYHLGSFSGNKLMGVKPQTDAKKLAVLQKLALYLTNEECQLARFDTVGWGPSNKNAQASDKIKNDPALAALAAQSAYAIPQGQIHGSWWDFSKVYGTAAKEAKSDDDLKKALEDYEKSIKSVLNQTEEQLNAMSVIGTVKGTNWDTDFPMTKQDDGTYLSDEAFDMAVGTEFKVRKGAAWDVSYGDPSTENGNFKVETAGKYKVKLTLDGDKGTIELVPAE